MLASFHQGKWWLDGNQRARGFQWSHNGCRTPVSFRFQENRVEQCVYDLQSDVSTISTIAVADYV